jgi:GntR family transcriptional regulator, transcriptional repressor for pyruvate dehydrogenase complex
LVIAANCLKENTEANWSNMMSDNAPLFDRINRPRRLPDEVAVSISSAIETGQLQPGDRLPTEAELSERFGVARTVVREAISFLRYNGVVDSRRGVGAFVADPSQRSAFRISPACFEKRKQIVQLLQLRTGVQAGASAIAAESRSDEQMEEIEGIYTRMAAADVLGPETALEERVDLELLLYRTITVASDNPYYVDVVAMIETNIQNNLRSAFLKNAATSEFGPAILEEHRAVVDALSAGDSEAARLATRKRFERAAERLAAREDFA